MARHIKLDSDDRFAFGKNWSRFLKNLDESRIVEAEVSLKAKLSCDDLFLRRI